MSNSDHHAPLLEKCHTHPLSSRPWNTVLVIAGQVILTSLVWAFTGVLIANKVVSLPDNLALWVHENPSETNLLLTMSSTALGLLGSYLLGVTVERALTSRLSSGRLKLSAVTIWINLASNSFIRPSRRYLRWTLISGLWLAVIHFLTAAWSNLLTPERIVRDFPLTGREPNFLAPAVADYTFGVLGAPHLNLTAPKYSLTLGSLPHMASTIAYYSQAGRSAATNQSTFIGTFESSTGGVLYLMDNDMQSRLLDIPPRQEKFKGLNTTYTLSQQGYTASVRCDMSSSPSINLSHSNPVSSSVNTSSGPFTYSLETWSWSTDCASKAQYYTGDVSILMDIQTNFTVSPGNSHSSAWGFLPNHARSETPIGRGLFATLVCFFQSLYGPSNQSFLVLMESSPGSNYTHYYSLPTVCEITPMITTMDVHYDASGTASVNNALSKPQVPTPDDCWPLVLGEGFVIWVVYFLAQGMYANLLADDVISLALPIANDTATKDVTPILEQYLRGMFEYTSTTLRNAIAKNLTHLNQPLPDNMTTAFTGTMKVDTMGWTFHLKTHGVALAVITLVTIGTAAFGTIALLEPGRKKPVRGPPQKQSAFSPTNLMDVLMASSMGSLSDALSRCEVEEDRDKLRVGVAVTDKGQPVLDATDGAEVQFTSGFSAY